MKYQVLAELIEELTTKTTDLNSDDIKQDFLSTDFIKNVIEISSAIMKKFKKFCETVTAEDVKKYLLRELDLMLDSSQSTIKLAVEYSNGNKKVDVPVNINLSFNQIKNKTEDYVFVYDSLLASIKTETERKAKDTALSELNDLKFHLSNIQHRLENYGNKIADAF